MIDDILELSRFELAGLNLNLEMVALEPLLSDAIEIVQPLVRGRPVQLNLTVATDVPLLEIDRTRIRQVVLNLLNNACSFTENGSIALSAHCVDHKVLISVRDTGPGIPSDKLSQLFDEFYQVDHSIRRNHRGAGLGLAISKRFVEAHGGRIWVDSQAGVGTCFTFTLPLSERLSTDQTNTRPVDQPSMETVRPCLLILERDEATVSIIRRHLKQCDIIQLEDGQALYEATLKYHPRAVILNNRPGLKPLDDSIRSEISAPIIECSLPRPAWLAQNLSVEGYLTKPISARVLIERIGQIGDVSDVLVIDDDRGFALLIQRILQSTSKSIEVRRAYSGAQGLVAVQERIPDLILLDLIMPDVDGLGVLAQLQANPVWSTIPVILITSKDEDSEPNANNIIVVKQRNGLYPIETLNCLSAIIGNLKPHYNA